MEEKVIQQESVASAEQSVAASDTTQTTPPAPTIDIDALKNELTQEKAARAKAEQSFGELKSKVDEMYKKADEKRVKTLENQGEYKPLWEEANKTNQERVKEIELLKGQIDELKRSSENAATRNTALSALSNAGAISADQTLALLQDKLQKSSDGRTVILNGGVEQDLGTS